MSMTIKTNLPALKALNILEYNSGAVTKENEKLSSGLKLNGAGDDASGYAISEKMEVNVRSLDQDRQNTQNGQNMLRVAEGAIQQSINILTAMKEKAISAANDDKTDEDRAAIQQEFEQYIDQIDFQSISTYNGKCLVDGSCLGATDAVATHLTNTSFSTDTTASTKLTDLVGRSQQPLGILETDKLIVSWVINGETKEMTVRPVSLAGFDPSGNPTYTAITLGDLFDNTSSLYSYPNVSGDILYNDVLLTSVTAHIGTDGHNGEVTTTDGMPAVSLVAANVGVAAQIAGITFNFFDSDGNSRTAANTVFDAFTETIRAEDYSEDNSLVFQIGTKAGQSMNVSLEDAGAVALGLVSATGEEKFLSVGTQFEANAAINVLDSALLKLTNEQTDIGSALSRLDHTEANLTVASENTTASMSTIRDADMAKEMTNYTKNNVLLQSVQSMLTQANQNSSAVLNLLQ